MAEGASIGSVYVDVEPKAANFWQKFQAQTKAGASRAGEQLGAAVGKGIQDRIAKGMADGIQRGSRSAQASAAKAGAESGGAYADAFKRRVEAALKKLPKAKIDADLSDAERAVAALRAEMEALSNKTIGVNITGAEARAEMDRLIAKADELGAKHPTVEGRTDLAAASAAMAAFGAEVDKLDGRQIDIQVDADTAGAQAQIAAVGGASLGSLSGMQALISAGIALGPTIVPAAAAATAAIGAIGPAASVGGAGLGVLALSIVPVIAALKDMQGVRDSATKGAAAQATAHKKLAASMGELAPAGQQFATFLFDLKDKFGDLARVSQQGLLPGLQAGIVALLPLMPQVTTLVGLLAQTMGDLFRQAGPVIAQILPPFLTMLGQVGPPIMQAFATILLNIGKGFGGIIEAFAPFAVQFFQGLADLSTKFADFGTTLSTNPGFHAFIDYVTANGPTLLSLLGTLAVLSIKLLVGFAPLGEMMLKGATAVAQFLAAMPPGLLLGIAYAIGLIVATIAALLGGPITAAVAVITIFAAAWVYAYTKVQWFHDLVNAYVSAIVAVVTWLWQQASAAFNGIASAIQTAWTFISPILSAIATVIGAVLVPIFMAWWAVVKFVLSIIAVQFQIAWAIIQIVFGLIQIGLTILGRAFMDWYNVHVKPTWEAVAAIIGYIWENKVRPVLSALGGFIRDYVVPAFRSAVDAIGQAWDRLRDLARKPIEFVVRQVINPLINGYNDLAKTFGAPHVNPIPGFAYGGFVSGPGGPREDKIFAMLSNGEYVIPAHVVRSLGVGFFDQLIGQPTTRYPGDGSQGLAFADGGFVGFFKDVWTGLTDPIGLLKKPAESLLNSIPGGAGVKGLLAGMGHKLIDGLLNFLGGGGAPGSDVNKTRAFVQSQVGKPYVWASAGPGGYDCSGIVSAAWNMLHGRSPYSHTFSTSNEAGFFPKPGPGGPLTAGWTNPGEPGPGGNNVGHTAGVIAGMPFESTGGVGVRAGRGVTPVGSFAHVGHFRDGGLIRMGTYDSGGQLPPGLTLAYNGTGSPETIRTADQEAALRRGGAQITQHIYPQRGQSEPEIAAAASRQLAWDLR